MLHTMCGICMVHKAVPTKFPGLLNDFVICSFQTNPLKATYGKTMHDVCKVFIHLAYILTPQDETNPYSNRLQSAQHHHHHQHLEYPSSQFANPTNQEKQRSETERDGSEYGHAHEQDDDDLNAERLFLERNLSRLLWRLAQLLLLAPRHVVADQGGLAVIRGGGIERGVEGLALRVEDDGHGF